MIRATAVVFGVLAMTACTPIDQVTQSVSLGQGAVIATAPAGYCVDPRSSQLAKDFAMLASCATLGHSTAAPEIVGIATIQVGPPDSGRIATDEIGLRDFLITDDGVRLLTKANNPDAVNVLSTQAFNDQVMIHFTDQGPPPLDGLQREEWRAFANVNGRLVTIGVRGLAASPLQDGPGATLLKQILAGVQAPPAAATDSPAEI
ncbi:dihydroxy-acid dehydratase [Yoonia sp. R78084]|uniref:dihydroxy-acid dehydratase n=1 Tax=Yoonia sp. R78084 TaxID=3093869 RepID=UPI0037DCF653